MSQNMLPSSDFINMAITTSHETSSIEFKETFDVASPQDWCEIIKDFKAIANSGGGIILFGLNNSGSPSGEDVHLLLELDPSDQYLRQKRF
jgi:hypothetical protein